VINSVWNVYHLSINNDGVSIPPKLCFENQEYSMNFDGKIICLSDMHELHTSSEEFKEEVVNFSYSFFGAGQVDRIMNNDFPPKLCTIIANNFLLHSIISRYERVKGGNHLKGWKIIVEDKANKERSVKIGREDENSPFSVAYFDYRFLPDDYGLISVLKLNNDIVQLDEILDIESGILIKKIVRILRKKLLNCSVFSGSVRNGTSSQFLVEKRDDSPASKSFLTLR